MELTREFFQNLLNNFATQVVQVVIILLIFTVVKKVGISLITRIFRIKIGRVTSSTPESLKQKETIKQLCINVFKYATNLLQVVLTISVFVSIGTLMASVGAFAIIITFAFQSMLADIVRGFFIIFEEMFLIGDLIEVAGYQGEVVEIGLQTTKIKLVSTKEIVLIPNRNVGNIVKLDTARVEALFNQPPESGIN